MLYYQNLRTQKLETEFISLILNVKNKRWSMFLNFLEGLIDLLRLGQWRE